MSFVLQKRTGELTSASCLPGLHLSVLHCGLITCKMLHSRVHQNHPNLLSWSQGKGNITWYRCVKPLELTFWRWDPHSCHVEPGQVALW
uniref:Uncharacterized protein n=1 Tax=Arundo donax TaxID=35708 RepID=A0A0A9B343_ARUDO